MVDLRWYLRFPKAMAFAPPSHEAAHFTDATLETFFCVETALFHLGGPHRKIDQSHLGVLRGGAALPATSSRA